MGGAIAVRVAARGLIPSLAGLAVIDVVEGQKYLSAERLLPNTHVYALVPMANTSLVIRMTWSTQMDSVDAEDPASQ